MSRGKRGVLWGLFLATASLLSASDIPPATLASLMLRVLSYDRRLSERPGLAMISIGVVFQQGNADSEAERRELTGALEDAAKRFNVSGKQVRVFRVSYAGPENLDADLAREKAVALYVCTAMDDDIGAISKTARQRSTLTFAGRESYVKAGLSIGLIRRGVRPAVLVNLAQSRLEGADLDSIFLRLAEVL